MRRLAAANSKLTKPDVLTHRFHPQLENQLHPRAPRRTAGGVYLSHHASNFLETEERKKSGNYQNTPSHQFAPTFARNFLNPFRNILVVKQRADNVLHHVKHPHEYAEDDRAINGRYDHRFASQPRAPCARHPPS